MTRPVKLTRPTGVAVLLLGVLAYLPALASSPGRMPADTKLYLYLDPGMLVRQAPFAWDTQQFGGWVPHQMISYLWPSGPFFWALDTIGVPDWVAHRLWLGTLFFLAGTGVLLLARRFGLPVGAAAVAAVVYQTTPYVVPYISRTSLMLLPYAALGWLCLAVWNAYRIGSWRWTAAAALIIATIGGVNGTAFLMLVPGPVLLVAWEWSHRRLAVRRVVAVTARLTVAAVAVSLWWVAMLGIQGRYGAAVLDYSETLEGVSFTSTAPEVVRSMGYWLAYVRDPYGAATTAALPYMSSVPLLVLSYAVPLLCMLGLIFTRWRYRGFATLLTITGIVLAVGFHPFDDPAPLFAPIRDSGLGLALRSSTRALPLLALGLGLSAAALLTAVRIHRPALGRTAAIALAVLAVLNLPALWRTQYVDPSLERDEQPPQAWLDAAAGLDDPSQRVLQVPGSEFGAFRWGYTVDPPLPGLMDASLITRDLLPLGSPGVMDLAYALDNRIQDGSLDPAAVAPVARLLGADHLWLTNDLAFDRFRTPRPERFAAELTGRLDGLGPVRSFGAAAANVPDIPMLDEDALSDPLVGTPLPPVQLRAIGGAAPLASTTDAFTVIDGSGDGVVSAAAAGWITGAEPIIYSNDLTADHWDRLPADTLYVVTDSNRDRSLQWRSSQETVGMTETGGPGADGLRVDPMNQRLPVFATDDPETQTRTVFDPAPVTATAYGEAFAFLPEYRAAMAVDGDPSTAWLAGQRSVPIGESITIPAPSDGQLRIVQPQDPTYRLMITAVDIEREGSPVQAVDLDPSSLTLEGQVVAVPGSGPVTVRITAADLRPDAPRTGQLWVGFAELGPVVDEYVQPPQTVLDRIGSADRVAVVFDRERTRATNRWRRDPEPTLRRQFTLAAPRAAQLTVTLGLDRRADDGALDALLGRTGPVSSRRLAGVPDARASFAFDADASTGWTSPFAAATGSELALDLQQPAPTTWTLQQPTDGRHSIITELTVRADTSPQPVVLTVGAPDADGRSVLQLPTALAGSVTITITGIDPIDTVDRRYGDPFELPVSILELSGPTPVSTPVAQPTCRTDLLTIDGQPVGLRVDDPASLLRDDTVTTTTCEGEPLSWAAGLHRIVSTPSRSTGITVDSVVIGDPTQRPTGTSLRSAATTVERRSPTSFRVEVAACADGCWLLFRQGYNSGWTAAVDGGSLGKPVQIDGGVNGWWLSPGTSPREVELRFAPQRTLTFALALSGLAVAVCVALLLWPRRRSPVAVTAPAPALAIWWQPTSRRAAIAGAFALVVGCALFIDVRWALPALVVAAGLVVFRQARWTALCGWIGISGLAMMVAVRQFVQRFPADAGWPVRFATSHRPMLFCCLVVAAAALAAIDRDEEST